MYIPLVCRSYVSLPAIQNLILLESSLRQLVLCAPSFFVLMLLLFPSVLSRLYWHLFAACITIGDPKPTIRE